MSLRRGNPDTKSNDDKKMEAEIEEIAKIMRDNLQGGPEMNPEDDLLKRHSHHFYQPKKKTLWMEANLGLIIGFVIILIIAIIMAYKDILF